MLKAKYFILLLTLVGLSLFAAVVSAQEVTDEEITALVSKVCQEIAADAPGTLARIVAAEHPYKNADNPAFYVFVYDTDVEIVAHPKAKLVGKSYKGKPDLKGNMFRDEIVAGALKDGTGWVNYVYQKPGEKGLRPKMTYFQLVVGSDGEQYVVCSGKYRDRP